MADGSASAATGDYGTMGRRLGRHRDRTISQGLLLLLVLLFAGLAIAYTRVTPIGQAPDELSHLGYVNGIALHLQLPLARTPERQQPPLFYLPHGLIQLCNVLFRPIRQAFQHLLL